MSSDLPFLLTHWLFSEITCAKGGNKKIDARLEISASAARRARVINKDRFHYGFFHEARTAQGKQLVCIFRWRVPRATQHKYVFCFLIEKRIRLHVASAAMCCKLQSGHMSYHAQIAVLRWALQHTSIHVASTFFSALWQAMRATIFQHFMAFFSFTAAN